MLKSVQETASRERLSRRGSAIAAEQQQQQQREVEQMNNSKELFGIQVDFNNDAGKLMSRSS
jgi:hypothetical protein